MGKASPKTKTNNQKPKKTIKIGKTEIELGPLVSTVVFILLIIFYFISPRVYSITTALYGKGSAEDQANVTAAMGSENTEKRFRLYFQWYNVIHELGHGLLYYNNGNKLSFVDEEQLANDFAVAYWKYYGEEEKLTELHNIVNYAVEHVGTNTQNGIDYMQLGRENSTGRSVNDDFFNFNDYGWFQFSSVKHAIETDKDLETVLKEMGFTNFKLTEPKTLKYESIDEDTSTQIINDATENFRAWGLKYPETTHHFSNDPNMNSSKSAVKYLWLFEFADYKYIFTWML